MEMTQRPAESGTGGTFRLDAGSAVLSCLFGYAKVRDRMKQTADGEHEHLALLGLASGHRQMSIQGPSSQSKRKPSRGTTASDN